MFKNLLIAKETSEQTCNIWLLVHQGALLVCTGRQANMGLTPPAKHACKRIVS